MIEKTWGGQGFKNDRKKHEKRKREEGEELDHRKDNKRTKQNPGAAEAAVAAAEAALAAAKAALAAAEAAAAAARHSRQDRGAVRFAPPGEHTMLKLTSIKKDNGQAGSAVMP
jgi:septal ring factor EnvC (AmiA/AmiB activator)